MSSYANFQQNYILMNDIFPGSKYTKIYIALGIAQVILALISYVVTSVALYLDSTVPFNINTGSGIWCGTLILVSGIICIISGRKPSYCWITSGLVLSVLSAVFASVMASLEITSILLTGGFPSTDITISDIHVILHSVLTCLACIEIIIACVYSGYCCAAVCCGVSNISVQHQGIPVTNACTLQNTTSEILSSVSQCSSTQNVNDTELLLKENETEHGSILV